MRSVLHQMQEEFDFFTLTMVHLTIVFFGHSRENCILF